MRGYERMDGPPLQDRSTLCLGVLVMVVVKKGTGKGGSSLGDDSDQYGTEGRADERCLKTLVSHRVEVDGVVRNEMEMDWDDVE